MPKTISQLTTLVIQLSLSMDQPQQARYLFRGKRIKKAHDILNLPT